jgi:hypothetical protein
MHCIQGSDAHRVTRDPQRPEKNLGIGDRCTEVLLTEVSFEALKALFASTDFSRTRPARAPEEHPFDPLTGAREDGATIVQAFHDLPGTPRTRVSAILKDVVAFANTNGGVIYVGASSDSREPIRGVEGAPELAELIRSESERQILPPLTPDIETLTSEDKTVLVVTVQKGTETPYALEPGYIYVRQEGETVLALRDEIVQLVRAALAPQTVGPDLASTLPPRPRPTPRVWAEVPYEQPEQPVPPPIVAPLAPSPIAPRDAEQVAVQQRDAQQFAVQQATAAEQERQQERTPVPRTGVEIIASIERNGLIYHTVRDLRNRRVVRNVTRESARRLWRYAILQAEQHTLTPEEVQWDERDPRFGFWKGYRQPEGMRRYNLVYREPANQRGPQESGERLRIFYGVTEEGTDERWRTVLPPDNALPVLQYDEDLQTGTMINVVPVETPPAPEPIPVRSEEPAPLPEAAVEPTVSAPHSDALVEPFGARNEVADAVPPSAEQLPVASVEERTGDTMTAPTLSTAVETAEPPALIAEEDAAAPRRRSRSRGGRRTSKAPPDSETSEPSIGEEGIAPPAADIAIGAEPLTALPMMPTAIAAPEGERAAAEPLLAEAAAEPTAAPKRRRAPRRAKATVEAVEDPAPEGIVSAPSPLPADVPAPMPVPDDTVTEVAPALVDTPPAAATPRRRRAPRKAKPVAEPGTETE